MAPIELFYRDGSERIYRADCEHRLAGDQVERGRRTSKRTRRAFASESAFRRFTKMGRPTGNHHRRGRAFLYRSGYRKPC